MNNVELYRQVFTSFRTLCAEGKQPSSFNAYCKAHGVNQCQMAQVLKGEYQYIRALSGYIGSSHTGSVCPLKMPSNASVPTALTLTRERH